MKHTAITKDFTTGATNDIRNYESMDVTNKYVTHDVINDGTTDLAYDIEAAHVCNSLPNDLRTTTAFKEFGRLIRT